MDWVRAAYLEPDRAQLAEEWKRHLAGSAVQDVSFSEKELKLRCRDGSVLVVLRQVTLLPDQGFSLVTFIDRSSLKKKEQALAELRRMEREAHLVCSLLLEQSQEMTLIILDENTQRSVRLVGFKGPR